MTPEQKLSYDTMHAELERLIADQPRINAETAKLLAETRHFNWKTGFLPLVAASGATMAILAVGKFLF